MRRPARRFDARAAPGGRPVATGRGFHLVKCPRPLLAYGLLVPPALEAVVSSPSKPFQGADDHGRRLLLSRHVAENDVDRVRFLGHPCPVASRQ